VGCSYRAQTEGIVGSWTGVDGCRKEGILAKVQCAVCILGDKRYGCD
jgi:hypothetical protein